MGIFVHLKAWRLISIGGRERERDGGECEREPSSPSLIGSAGVVIGSAGLEERERRPPAQHLCRLPFDQLSLVTERERGKWRKRAETSAAKSRWTSMPWPRFFSGSDFFSNQNLSSNFVF